MSTLKAVLGFILWEILPIALTATASVFAPLAAIDTVNSTVYRSWLILFAVLLGALLIAKAIRNYKRTLSVKGARYAAIEELHNGLGPALGLVAEMALLDPADKTSRSELLRNIAAQCCSALRAMTPDSANVRAVVFELRQVGEIYPIGWFGRRDSPRSFSLSDAAGQEVLEFLESHDRGELYEDTKEVAPRHYSGDRQRYRTFIRTPIRVNGVTFGMLTIDAPKEKTLTTDDIKLVDLVAAEMAIAFAIAAG